MFRDLRMRALFFSMAVIVITCLAAQPAVAEPRLQDMHGNTVRFSDFKGKVVILDFFAPWCPPCKQEIPDFVELQREYGDQGFTIVGVSLSGAPEMQSFAQRFGINYPVLIDNGKAHLLYGPVRSIPTTLVLDRDLKVVKQYIGYTPKSVFEADIRALLGKPGAGAGRADRKSVAMQVR